MQVITCGDLYGSIQNAGKDSVKTQHTPVKIPLVVVVVVVVVGGGGGGGGGDDNDNDDDNT